MSRKNSTACSDLIVDLLSHYPLCKLVYGDKQVGVALGRPFKGFTQIEPTDRERPRDGDRLERLGL